MINEYELIKSLSKSVSPSMLDTVFQGVFACVLIILAQGVKPDTSNNHLEGLWAACFVLLWGVQHYFFRMIWRRRTLRVESQYDELPNGLFRAATHDMTPHWMDATFQALGLFLLMHWYFDSWSQHLPEYLVNYVWAPCLLLLWLLQNRFLRIVLEERGRNAFYRTMYEKLAKQTQS
ncbi:MAG: hypothetical protein OXG24_02135 [Gammaproteobacteria bacterium]|nr:hypothetical protein [Gammaproteobacteria bacterium]